MGRRAVWTARRRGGSGAKDTGPRGANLVAIIFSFPYTAALFWSRCPVQSSGLVHSQDTSAATNVTKTLVAATGSIPRSVLAAPPRTARFV